MFIAGLTVLITSASAAVRTLQATIGEMQGGRRYQGFSDFLFSLVFSLAFLASMYFGILVMFTGRDFIKLLNGWLPFIDIRRSWQWIRFLLLGGIELVIFWGIYAVSRRHRDHYAILPGALFATLGLVVMSWLFSGFIAVSTRYPLVYGSLASLILLMFWLHLCCQIIYVGAALNIALRDVLGKEKEA
jgi:membrane protein